MSPSITIYAHDHHDEESLRALLQELQSARAYLVVAHCFNLTVSALCEDFSYNVAGDLYLCREALTADLILTLVSPHLRASDC